MTEPVRITNPPITDEERRQIAALEKALADGRREERLIDTLIGVVVVLAALTLLLGISLAVASIP